MQPRTRRELGSMLEEVMNSAYSELHEHRKLRSKSNLVKTYLVEAHRLSGSKHTRVLNQLRSSLRTPVAAEFTSRVLETDEEFLYTVKFRRRSGEISVFIDATDPRFWLAHSIDHSDDVDPIIRSVVAQAEELDFAWLPVQLLESISTMGLFRGLG